MLQEPMHQTKDDKPQCQATTKKGTRLRFVIFLLLCAFEETTSFDRSRAYSITQPEFVSQRGFPREEIQKPLSAFARAFFSPLRVFYPAAFSPTRCSRMFVYTYVPQATSANAQPRKAPNIARNTPGAPSKEEKRGAFRSFERKQKNKRDTAFFCASSRDAQNKRERETFITKRKRERASTERARVTSERES